MTATREPVLRLRPAVAERTRDERRLRLAATFFAIAVLIHNSDHLRRGGDSVSASVFWIGTAAVFLEVALVVLVFANHPLAPQAATLGGFVLAVGYIFVHFTPTRAWLSDSFVSGGASALSVFAAGIETAAAITLAFVGRSMWPTREEWREPRRQRASIWSALRHPVPLTLLIGNVIILVGSFITRY